MGAKPEKVFQGSGVSPGVALGQALKIDNHHRPILKIHVDDVEEEIRRFLRAMELSKVQLKALKTQMEEKLGAEHGIILDAHLLILEDKTLHAEILASIRDSDANAEWAVIQARDRLVRAYESLEDEYFRERHSDIEHVVERLLNNLSGNRPFSWEYLPDDLILVSRDFNISNFATMDLKKVRGLVLESGGRTSHSAIISRGLRLPAVMGIHGILASVATGDALLLNGDEGQVIVHPSRERIESVRRKLDAFGATPESAPIQTDGITRTRNGTGLSLRANTELPIELEAAKAFGAEGIGLYRSEFLFFSHPQGFPQMEAQLIVYRRLAREMSPYPVAIRTLDAGSERIRNSSALRSQENPSMGLRGIRLSLSIRDAFRTQIEAILRAGCEGNIEMVLPMVSTVEEIRQAKTLIEQVRLKSANEAGAVLSAVPLGVMIEVPAAVLSLEALAAEADFLCVGTNDLIQYLMAVDRGNPQVAYLFQPLHPSVLRCLMLISEIADKTRKPVRICGEISSNPYFAVLLLGMGFTQLSMNPLSIPTIRRVLQEVPIEAAQSIARQALTFITARDVHAYLVDAVSKLISWDLRAYSEEIAAPNDRNQR
jgi:phosphotransferase system enzyme I (PtsI)